ncbi:thioredoxin family protein [Dyadobacter psychrotolerans]|uniref:Thioredoxin family protein n=1 Tax=Dyadobacter psychrotolerans TaxID=2541721 RepID=A0A4R5DH21_9BACT|nr:thioredoxin family protein [Dyadobacter psychrotolerans]TDE12537.1 thioredoxin family protein [Dyadobacter psychrotolerans]
MTILIFILSLNLTTLSPLEFISRDHPVKKQQTAEKRKLIVFSGSDWCKNCILFKKEVLNSQMFQDFAKENIEIVTADFPQKKQLSAEEVKRNEALAEKYNKQGEFPKLILLSADESEGKIISYSQSPEKFVAELKSLLAR